VLKFLSAAERAAMAIEMRHWRMTINGFMVRGVELDTVSNVAAKIHAQLE
jgi:hypothetical protein